MKRRKVEKTPPCDLSQPLEALTWRVDDREDAGERIDRFLRERLTWRSRASIVDLLSAGKVLRNGVPVTKKSFRVRLGDEIAVLVPAPDEEVRHEELGLQLCEAILHDDQHLIVLNKPAGMVVHPVGRVRANTVIQALHWAFHHGPLKREGRGLNEIPRICHRLDKNTSGVLVFAKTPAARTAVQHTFDAHDMEKDYRGVVVGRVAKDSGRIDLPIGRDEEADVGTQMTTRPDGQPSLTTYTVDARFDAASSVRFRIHTGRQHQIRVHARALGHPILLDPLYGDGARAWPPDSDPVIERQALHAERLAMAHPITGDPLELVAPLPADLRGLLARLV